MQYGFNFIKFLQKNWKIIFVNSIFKFENRSFIWECGTGPYYLK